MPKIKNINGTTGHECKCGSWLKHWERHAGKSASYCAEITCVKTDLVGARVQKVHGDDTGWYIIPLCTKHNQAQGELDVSAFVKIIPAVESEVCGK